MKLQNLLLAAVLASSSAITLAADYYVVVPVRGRTAPAGALDGPTLSRASLDFGARQRGDVGVPVALTLTNPGTRPLTIAAVTVPESGTAVGFSVQHDCGVLAPAASCTGYIYYRPVAAGQHATTLVISHDGWRRTAQVPLSGIARDPSASLSIPAFGEVNVGSAKDQLAVFTNTGVGNITVGTPSASGTGYTIVDTDCPSPLSPADSCNVTTRLTASATGPLTGVLSVPSGAGAITASLAGFGISSDLEFSSGLVAGFGSIAVGSSAMSGPITLKNKGNVAASGLALMVNGASGYSIENSTCGSAIPAGETCSFAVKYTPASPGAHLADLQAVVDGKVSASSPLSGVGTSAAVFLTARVTINYVMVGTVLGEYYTVTNSSSSPISISSKSLSHPDPALSYALAAGANECGSVVPAMSTCRVNFNVQAADVVVTKPMTLTLNTSAGKLTSGAMVIGASWPKLVPSPLAPAFDFGSVVVGNEAVSTKVTVTNKALAINVNDVTYSIPEGFSLVNSSCGTTSIRASVCELYLKFSPTAAKAYKGTFTMTAKTQYTGTGGTPQPYVLSIPVSGVGAAPSALSWQGGALDIVEKGVTRTTTLMLYNPAATSVALGTVALSGNTTEFRLASTTCATTLAANSGCTATVAFTPAGTGARTPATISVAAGGVAVSKSLTATAGEAILTATPTSLAFATRYANRTGATDAFSDLKVTIKNTGTAAAESLSGSVTYDGAALGFSFQNNSCVNRLNAGSSCSVVVRATGTVLGTNTGSVKFNSASGLVTIPFSFTIVPMDVGVVTVTPVQDTVVGKGTVSQYSVSTSSTGKVVVEVPTITGNTAEYSIAAGSTCSEILAMNSSCVINVLFTPTSTGTRPQGTLNVKVGGIMRTVSLVGAGLAP